MSDISNQLIKDSYDYVLQSDLATGIVYRIGGNIAVNPIFSSGLTIYNAFNYSDGSESNGYVLTSDGSGNATWKPVSATTPSSGVTSITVGNGLSADSSTGAVTIIFTGSTGVSGDYLPLSGGTVTGDTIFQSGLTGNTIYVDNKLYFYDSTNSVYNTNLRTVDVSFYVNDGTNDILTVYDGNISLLYSGNSRVNLQFFPTSAVTRSINIPDGNGTFILKVNGQTPNTSGEVTIPLNYLPLSGGTVTGNTIFQSGLTANTISATTYQNLPSQSGTGISAFSYNQSTGLLTITKNDTTTLTAGTFSYITATTLSSGNVLSVTSNGGSATTTTINAVTGGSYSNGTIILSGTGNVNGTQITGLSALTPTTLYSGNGTLSGNRVVNISGFSLNFSSSTRPNTLVLSSGNVGIGNSSPSAKLHVGTSTSFLKVTPQWLSSLGTWIDLSTDGPSGIGSGGPGVNPWVAYVSFTGAWFGNASIGDIAYRNTTGKLLFGNTAGNAGMSIYNDNVGIGTVTPSNKLHVYSVSDPLKLEGVQTSTDTELLTIDGIGVVHKISTSSIGSPFLRNETNPSTTDTIQINQSIFNPADLTVLSTSVFIVDTNADYYILGDLYNYGSIIVNGTLKVGGIIYNYGTITGPGIIE